MKKRGFAWFATVLLLLITTGKGMAQLRFAYYDADRLYDTSESLFYNDKDYTPEGRYQWNSIRYNHKIEQTAARIDSLRADVVALYGVENEQVVRDIAMHLKGDYTYLHRTLNTFDGMDFALLYFADRCEPLRAEAERSMLTIEALMGRDTVMIILGADPRFVRLKIKEVQATYPTRRLIVAGKIGSINPTAYGLTDRMAEPARRGHGTCVRNGQWQMRDRIYTSPACGTKEGAVVIQHAWLDRTDGAPCPTYEATRYRGGAGRYLPLWCEIE